LDLARVWKWAKQLVDVWVEEWVEELEVVSEGVLDYEWDRALVEARDQEWVFWWETWWDFWLACLLVPLS
jgi:hypothetical protein